MQCHKTELTVLHSELPTLYGSSFDRSECNRVKPENSTKSGAASIAARQVIPRCCFFASGRKDKNYFCYKKEFLSFQNNPKNLDLSYKTYLNLSDCLGRVKLIS